MAKIGKKAADKIKAAAGFMSDNPKWLWDHYGIGTVDFKQWLGNCSPRSISKMVGSAEDGEDAAHRLARRMSGKDKPDDLTDLADLF